MCRALSFWTCMFCLCEALTISHRTAGARLLLYPDDQQFDACLPRLEKAVRITGLYDAQVFTRRWIIRDKDPALKALMRCLDKARSSETAASALVNFKNALA